MNPPKLAQDQYTKGLCRRVAPPEESDIDARRLEMAAKKDLQRIFSRRFGNQSGSTLSMLRMVAKLMGCPNPESKAAAPTRAVSCTKALGRWAAPALALALGGCAAFPHIAPSEPPFRTVPAAAGAMQDRPHVGRSRLALGGEEDFVVRIVAPGTTCSGTLIAEDLVLTAHHCVSVRDGKGRMLPADLDPEQLTVEVGSGHFPWAEISVRAIVSPGCGHAAGVGDLAILVLPRRLHGVRYVQPALDREPQAGDEVSHIGFGRCALSEDGIYLKHRAAGRVDWVSRTGFRVNVPLCPGDSGGPVMLDASPILVGVVSAGAMDGDESSPDRVEFTRIDPFRNLFANAARVASGTPISELPPVDCPLTQPELDATMGLSKAAERRR